MLSALYRLTIACPSVVPVCHTGGSVKTVEVKIMKFSLYDSPIPLVFRGKFHPKILTGSSRAGASNNGRVGKTSHFLAAKANISKTVGDTAKVTILITNSNRKSHRSMRFRLSERSMTLDDLKLLSGQILSEFGGILQIWEPTTAKRM